MIKAFLLTLWNFITSITIESVQYLGWTSAVIGALLALTTIIFSQYNDKLVQKSNDISTQLKEKAIDKSKHNEIVIFYNNMVSSLANQSIYKKTLVLFQAISFCSALIWLISGIGYAHSRKELTNSDIFIVYVSTLLIVATFIFLPIIIKGFNNYQPIKVSNKNTVNIKDVLLYLENEILNKTYIIKEIFNPKISFTLDYRNNLKIDYRQSIVASNVILVLELINNENTIYIKINNKSYSNKRSSFLLKSKNKKENNFAGLFSLINKPQISKKMYIFTYKNKEFLGCFKTTTSLTNENEILFLIDDYFHSSVHSNLEEFINSKLHFSLNGNKDYKLITTK